MTHVMWLYRSRHQIIKFVKTYRRCPECAQERHSQY